MHNSTTFQIKARTMLCTSLAVLLTACGGGSGTDTSQTELLKSANANQGSNGYVSTDTSSTTTTASTDTTATTGTPTATDTTTATNTTTPSTTTTTSSTTTSNKTPYTATTKNFYVATTGSDSNPGTQAAPFRTIKKAASVATAGYTVHVADGTYNEQVATNLSGTASAYITYVSDNKWGAKIVSPGTGTTAAWQNNGDYVAILGFDITGGGALGINHSGSGDIASYNHVHHIPAAGCTSFGGAGIGFDNYNGKSGFLADSNVVNDIGPLGTSCGRVQGIYPSIPNGTISNNLVYRVVGYAIHAYHDVYNTKIVNNTMFGNGNPGGDGGGIAIGGNTSGFPTSAGFVVTNNIVYDNQGIGIHEEGTQGTNTYSNNLVLGNTTNYGTLHSSRTADVSANPQFVNYLRSGGGNYRLTSTSPAVNAGTSNGAPSIDIDGTTRAQGVGFDIGAYEYH